MKLTVATKKRQGFYSLSNFEILPKPKLKDIYGSVRPGPNSGQEKK